MHPVRIPWLVCLALMGSVTAASAAGADPVAAAWQRAALIDLNGSLEAFAALQEVDPSREARLGQAVLLASAAPRTPARLETARAALEALAEEDVLDDVDASARFFLGRIAHLYEEPADLARAAQRYAEVRERHPGHALAGMATVRLSIVELLRATDDASRRSALAAAEVRVQELTAPAPQIDLHLVLAEAWWRSAGDAARALEHLLAADALGGSVRTSTQIDQWVTIGELARRIGRNEVARRYFARAVAEAPRDERADELRGVMAGLERDQPAAEGGGSP